MSLAGRLRETLVATLSTVAHGLGENNTRRARGVLGEVLARITPPDSDVDTVQTAAGPLRLFAYGEMTRWRSRSFFTKEPETLEWIDGFERGSVLWDIGANVGLYSLYAALTRECTVVCFEPGAANYFLLNRNIERNGLAGRISAYCVAAGPADGFDHLNMADTSPGGAMSTLGECVDYQGSAFTPSFRQGAVAYSLDTLAARPELPFPDHIKIDVDGLERDIVRAGPSMLADPRLQSVSIELDEGRPGHTGDVLRMLADAGLTLVWKRHAEMFEGGKFETLFNFCFKRDAETLVTTDDDAQTGSGRSVQ